MFFKSDELDESAEFDAKAAFEMHKDTCVEFPCCIDSECQNAQPGSLVHARTGGCQQFNKWPTRKKWNELFTIALPGQIRPNWGQLNLTTVFDRIVLTFAEQVEIVEDATLEVAGSPSTGAMGVLFGSTLSASNAPVPRGPPEAVTYHEPDSAFGMRGDDAVPLAGTFVDAYPSNAGVEQQDTIAVL